MNDKNIYLICPQLSPSSKYPTLKKSQESKKDIAFRLNFSSIKNQERNINHVMGTFEKPFTTLGVNAELRKQFNQIIIDLKETFKQVDKDHSNSELNQKFWEQWNQFDTILHQMSVHSAYYYCSREIERLTLDITGAIKSIKSNPPAVPGIQHEFSVIVEKIQKSFVQIVDRFAEIVDSKIDESKKIRDLESMRNQIRQFRTDVVGERSKFFSLSSANHATQEKAKQTIETSLTTIISTISDLKRQTYLLDNLDNEIAQAMRVIEMMIDGDPLPNARSERIQEKVKIEKENLVENQSGSPLTKSKSNISRRCTINPSNNGNKNRRSSRRRKSIKRNASLIELDKSASENESDVSFCSTLSEFQDGKELLFDSVSITADFSDIDEDSMFQISDDYSDCIDIEKDEHSEKVHNDNEKNEKNIEEENKVNDEKDDTDSFKHRFSIKGRMIRLSDDDENNQNTDNEDANQTKATDINQSDEEIPVKDNKLSDDDIDLNDNKAILDQEEKETIPIKDNDSERIENIDNINQIEDSSKDQLSNDQPVEETLEEEKIIDSDAKENDNDEPQNDPKFQETPKEEEITQLSDEEIQDDNKNNNKIVDITTEIPIANLPEKSVDFKFDDKIQNEAKSEDQSKRNLDSETNTNKKDINLNIKNNQEDNNTNNFEKNKEIISNSVKINRRRSRSKSLLLTSDESGEEFLSSDLEEISIPLVFSCPLLTFEQVPIYTKLSTSNLLSFEKVDTCSIKETKIKTKKDLPSNCYMTFLLVCFMIITFLLLFSLNIQ